MLGLRNSCAAIPLFDAPPAARPATRASCGVRSKAVSALRARARSPVVRSSVRATSAKCPAPMLSNMS